MRAAMFAGLLLLAAGCKVGALLEPLPVYVWTCVEWRVVRITDSAGNVAELRYCIREGFTRRVDTLPPAATTAGVMPL